ncbi:hypothetical protein Q9L58_006825 [Maublancomyces gigas]|uniref:Uncharacterized protein n=1 Tax=Discina gigas TaxID=1032678 RepID=A0ABR3GEY0_9PEZI
MVRRSGREQTEEILENLPLTRAFIERLPRSLVADTAAANDAKAIEAIRLINRVDELIESHVAAARDLRSYVSQLSTMTAAIATASSHTHHIHAQLRDLDALATELQNVRDAEMGAGEDVEFAKYVMARR